MLLHHPHSRFQRLSRAPERVERALPGAEDEDSSRREQQSICCAVLLQMSQPRVHPPAHDYELGVRPLPSRRSVVGGVLNVDVGRELLQLCGRRGRGDSHLWTLSGVEGATVGGKPDYGNRSCSSTFERGVHARSVRAIGSAVLDSAQFARFWKFSPARRRIQFPKSFDFLSSSQSIPSQKLLPLNPEHHGRPSRKHTTKGHFRNLERSCSTRSRSGKLRGSESRTRDGCSSRGWYVVDLTGVRSLESSARAEVDEL